MIRQWPVILLLASACAHTASPEGPPLPPSAEVAAPKAASLATVSASGLPALPSTLASVAPAPSVAPVPSVTSTATEKALAPPTEGEDFIAQATTLFRVAACGSSGEAPARFDAKVLTHHCDELARAYDEYKKTWLDTAEPFLANLRPKDLPGSVVYPFGGGDLVTALATFPSASEIDTISLEPVGDVRPIDQLAPDRLAPELAAHRDHLLRLFEKAHSRTDNLEKGSQAELPGELVFALAALVVHGDEPVSLQYFRIRPDGTIDYITASDIDGAAHHPKALRSLFDNVELRFRKAGDAQVPIQVLRHIAFNLDDAHLKADPALMAYLGSKGKVATMTKAASHLLWSDHFSTIRGWLIEHTDWMISDSTGIPPRYAQPAGFSQDTYGKFDGPATFGLYEQRDGADFQHLFATEPARELSFRYGYPDKDGHAHLIVTHK